MKYTRPPSKSNTSLSLTVFSCKIIHLHLFQDDSTAQAVILVTVPLFWGDHNLELNRLTLSE